MSGVPHTPEAGWRTGRDVVAARRVDLDPAGGSDCQLGGPSAAACGTAKLHGRASGKGSRGRYGAKRRSAASTDAHLSYGAAGCASDCGLFEVSTGPGALVGAIRRDVNQDLL